MKNKVHYKYVEFTFYWNWIRNKQIILSKGSNEFSGMLIIADEDGNPIKMYGYELINNVE
jgi:hypothetical protein